MGGNGPNLAGEVDNAVHRMAGIHSMEMPLIARQDQDNMEEVESKNIYLRFILQPQTSHYPFWVVH